MLDATATPRGGIAVLGFHRSGTSLIARVLNLLGLDLGPEDDLLPPYEGDNPLGYWEPRWMNDLNDEVLAAIGGSTWAPLWATAGWQDAPELEPLRARAGALLAEKFAGRSPWGWKDPRTSLTLPFWEELIPDLRRVVCVRSPADAVASALRRSSPALHRWSWGQLWLEYTARALAGAPAAGHIVVFYEDLLADPERETDRLAAFLGVDPEPARAAIAETMRDDLRHHRSSPSEVAADAGLPIEARAAFLALRATRDAGDGPLSGGLRRIVGELWSAHRDGAVRSAELEQARAEADAAGERAQAAEEAERAARGALEALRAEHDGLRAEVEALRGELSRARGDLAVVTGSRSWRVTAPFRSAARRRKARRGE